MEHELKMLKAAEASKVVPQVYGVIVNEDKGIFCIVMELCEGKNLLDFMSSKPPRKLVHQIVLKLREVLFMLNETGVIHNDLKCDNIMVSVKYGRCVIRIIDLGLSKFVGEAPYPYVSYRDILRFSQLDPSLANGGACSPSTDLYSLAVILLELYTNTKCSVYEKLAAAIFEKNYTGTVDITEVIGENCRC